MHVDVSTYLFGGGRNNLVPSLALCKLMCYRSARCTTGTYIMEGTRTGQCWLSGQSIEAAQGAAVPLLNCGVPCRSFINDHEFAKQHQKLSPINLLRGAGGTLAQVPDSATAGLPPIESEQPPMAVALDEQTPQKPARTQLHRIWSQENEFHSEKQQLMSASSAPVTAVALDEDVEDIQDAQDLDLAALRGGN